MILFDILSVPAGASFNDWYELYKEGIIVYDSSIGGIRPIVIDNDKLSVIDVSSMDEEESVKFGIAFNEVFNRRRKEFEDGTLIMRNNTKELIKYLKKINDEVEGKTVSDEEK